MMRELKITQPAVFGATLMVGAGALFAINNTLAQLATMRMGMASTTFAFWQYLVATCFALPWLYKNGLGGLLSNNAHWHILRVLLSVAGVQLWVAGLAYVPIWQAIALLMLSPFFVTIGASLFLNERTTVDRWNAVIIGFVGGMIILAPWSDAFSTYALLPVGAAFFWAMVSLITKSLTKTEKPEILTAYLLLLLTPLNALTAVWDGFDVELSLTTLILPLIAGALTTAAQFLLAKSYSVADAAYLQPFDHVKLAFNVLFGIFVFGFYPPGSMWLGTTLIVLGSFYLLHRETKKEEQKATP